MSIFEGFKRLFNIGGADIVIGTEKTHYGQGEQVRGHIVTGAKEFNIDATSLRIDLEEYWTETRGSGKNSRRVTVYHSRDAITLARDLHLEQGKHTSFDFELQLPLNARLTDGDEGWRLNVAMDVANAIDPAQHLKLEVGPAPEMLTLARICEGRLKFKEDPRYRSWSSWDSYTTLRLYPPQVLQSELDFIQFKLQQGAAGDGITGTIAFDLQEKSIGDYLKAIINYDQVEFKVRFKNDELYTEDRKPNEQHVSEVLGALLKQVLVDRTKQ